MTKEEAAKILAELGSSPNMVKHGFAVSFAMAALHDYFLKNGQGPELTCQDWEIVGLLHDADYELTGKSLEDHTEEITKRLKEVGSNQLIIEAIRGHCDKAPRTTLVAKSVYAADELTGLIVACALVQPDKKLKSVRVESVMRKFKDKDFARGAHRDQIETCQLELGIPLEEFIAITLGAMQNHADELGL